MNVQPLLLFSVHVANTVVSVYLNDCQIDIVVDHHFFIAIFHMRDMLSLVLNVRLCLCVDYER